MVNSSYQQRHGLSGGEVSTSHFLILDPCPLLSCDYDTNDSGSQWQRIAIARAFMRATEPSVDLLVFDEPVRVTSYFFAVLSLAHGLLYP